MRRPAAVIAPLVVLLVLAAAACGSEGTVTPRPQKVVGTLKQEDPGKAIFAANGCNGCHTYAPAEATGKVGPDLDKLAQYAQSAKQPIDAFTRESIVDPNAYVEKGFAKGIMPSFKQLPASDVDALVQFLTKPSS